jgi:hypothetical protein
MIMNPQPSLIGQDSPLLALLPCDHCRGLGVWLDPNGALHPCPRIEVGEPHAGPTDRGAFIVRSLRRLRQEKQDIGLVAFEVAKALLPHSADDPCDRRFLTDRYFTWTNDPLRQIAYTVAELRYKWFLPVLSSKDRSGGYWIAADQTDFEAWFVRARSAPVTQLGGLHSLARATFPVFAEQAELDFWSDMQPVEVTDAFH